MRAVLLPAGPDPFLLAYWFRNFNRVWGDEVDEVHCLVADQSDPEVREYIRAQGDHRVKFSFYPKRIDHGQALMLLFAGVTADSVLFMEDDAYVRRSGEIDAHFRCLERNEWDVIGSPRGNASVEIIDAANTRWEIATAEESGESGHALWPSFLFAKRDTLLGTDQYFGARSWTAGEEVQGLNLTAGTHLSADTLGSVTYQLRDKGARIKPVAQYRTTGTGLMSQWIGHAPWFHVGSLSSGYGSHLANDSGHVGYTDPGANGEDWARRVSWWERFVRTANGGLPAKAERYRAELDAFVARSGIDRSQVDGWTSAFNGWVTWNDVA